VFRYSIQKPKLSEVEIVLAICPLAALPRGEARRVETDPPIAVFHTEDGQVFAIDDTCTHQDASLSEGWLEDCMIECPLHAASFDLRTGKPTGPPAKRPVRTYPVLVEDGVVYVDAPARASAPAPAPADDADDLVEARTRQGVA
jgi:3-phenylpropionate/trans-cinnamate dioxygenase ferredoxin component